MPGESVRSRSGKIGGIAEAEFFQGSSLGGRVDLNQAVLRIDALGRKDLGEQDQILQRSRIRVWQIPNPGRPVIAGGGKPAPIGTEGEMMHPAAMSQGWAKWLSGGRVRQPSGVVSAAPRGQTAAVRAESDPDLAHPMFQ